VSALVAGDSAATAARRDSAALPVESMPVNRSQQPRAAASAWAVKTRFLVIGIWNTLFGLAAFALADVTIGRTAGYVASVTLMFAVAIPQAHLAQRLWVWRSHGPYLPELFRFSWVYLVAYIVNVILLAFAVEVLHAATLPAQFVISSLIAVSTYVIHRAWTFRTRHVTARPGTAVAVSDGVLRIRESG
jgi:putative flippase GtrA